jgi:hypothetical protein
MVSKGGVFGYCAAYSAKRMRAVRHAFSAQGRGAKIDSDSPADALDKRQAANKVSKCPTQMADNSFCIWFSAAS